MSERDYEAGHRGREHRAALRAASGRLQRGSDLCSGLPLEPTGKVSQCWFMLIKMKIEKKKKSQELPHGVRCQSLVSVKKPQLFMSKVPCEWLKQCNAGKRYSYWVRVRGCLCSAFSPEIFLKAESVLFRTDWLSKWLRMRISVNSSSIIYRFVFCSKFSFCKA